MNTLLIVFKQKLKKGKIVNSLFTFGYIDPSVVTYAIQAGAGVVIAVGAVIGLYFRKAKKKVSKKLNIDENKNKEVESDEIVVAKKTAKKTTKKTEKPEQSKKKSTKKTTKK